MKVETMGVKMKSKTRVVKGMVSDGSYERMFKTVMANDVAKNAYDEATSAQRTADLVKDMRTRAGLSQRALAELSKVSQPAIARLEQGEGPRGPGIALVGRIAKACGVELMMGYFSQKPAKVACQPQRRKVAANVAQASDVKVKSFPAGKASESKSIRYVGF